jgi:site-specific recombinase XerD
MRISNELIAQIGLYYTAKGYRETTIRDMISDMLLFQKYCKKHNITSVEEIKHKIINEYTIYAAKSRTPKTSRYF